MKVTDSLQLFCSNAGLVRLPQLQPAVTPSRELKMNRVKRKLELNAANVQNEKNHEPRDTSSDFSPHTEPESRGIQGGPGGSRGRTTSAGLEDNLSVSNQRIPTTTTVPLYYYWWFHDTERAS